LRRLELEEATVCAVHSGFDADGSGRWRAFPRPLEGSHQAAIIEEMSSSPESASFTI